MKIIHCADLHLDSRMLTNFGKEKAAVRRGEILHTFERMVEYAAENGVSAILLAGDLFDSRNISKSTRAVVMDAVLRHPLIGFYYLRGNHDVDNFLSEAEKIPENLHLFENQWTEYSLGENVFLYGTELNETNAGTYASSLIMQPEGFHIVMLHGQDSEQTAKDRVQVINMNEFRNRGIDYLALGHVHAPKIKELDNRGKVAYPGCLEGRGYDETGAHGFYLLDIRSANDWSVDFVPFASRQIYCVPVNISNCADMAAILESTRNALRESGARTNDMVKIVLTGEVGVDTEKNPDYLVTAFCEEYFHLKVEDRSLYRINPADYQLDASLRGEFVRTVFSREDLSEEEKAAVIRYGFLALEGGDLE